MSKISALMALAGFTLSVARCQNKATTPDLLDADFLATGHSAIELLSPVNNAATTQYPSFNWTLKAGISSYQIEIAADANFSQVVASKTIEGNAYALSNSDLVGLTKLIGGQYFWRISTAYLKTSLQSQVFSFQVLDPNIYYVNCASDQTVQVGSKSAPYKQIQAAINAASASRTGPSVSVAIYVAQGTCVEDILLKPGISIYGGYEPVNWTRNITANISTVTAALNTAFTAGADITAAYTASTIVDGFTVNGGSVVGFSNHGFLLNNSYPTISNNRVDGGGGQNSYGLFNSASSPTLIGNTFSGGSGSSGSNGMYLINTTTTVSNQTFYGGTNAYSTGIYIFGGAPVIVGNSIDGGKASQTHGIWVDTASPTVINNVIYGGASVSESSGIYQYWAGTPIVTNNTIHAGTSCTKATAFSTGGGSKPIVTNNIMFAGAGPSGRYGFWEDDSSSDSLSFQNNLIFDVTVAYTDEWSNARTTQAHVNTSGNTTQGTAASSSGNVGPDTVGSVPYFFFANTPQKFDVTIDGGDAGSTYDGTSTTLEITNCTGYTNGQFIEYDGDGVARTIISCSTGTGSGVVTFSPALASTSVRAREIRLWGTNSTNLAIDYRLTASTPATLLYGGKDASQSTCGSLGASGCGNVTHDLSGNARTVPYSIGAFERD